jgi:hypothetical protein
MPMKNTHPHHCGVPGQNKLNTIVTSLVERRKDREALAVRHDANSQVGLEASSLVVNPAVLPHGSGLALAVLDADTRVQVLGLDVADGLL